MPLNADQLLAVFPHPVLTEIIVEPNLASIMLQQSEHNGNLASIKSNLGDGLTGLMVLSMAKSVLDGAGCVESEIICQGTGLVASVGGGGFAVFR